MMIEANVTPRGLGQGPPRSWDGEFWSWDCCPEGQQGNVPVCGLVDVMPAVLLTAPVSTTAALVGGQTLTWLGCLVASYTWLDKCVDIGFYRH